MQNTSRWGHHDHCNKMIIEECRRTASIACRTTVSMSAVQRTQSVQATPTHRARSRSRRAVIMPAPPHIASAASRRLVPRHPRAATTAHVRESRAAAAARRKILEIEANDHSCHVSFMASMSELSPPLVSHLRHRKAAQRRHTRSTLSQHKPGRPKSDASIT